MTEKRKRSSWSKHTGKWPCPDCGGNKDRRAVRCKDCATKTNRGANANAFKNGRFVQNGYVKVLNPDPNRTKNTRYVYEHRLVMEQSLGRKLLPNENIHHINGDRSDNRLENLELWVTSQPSGQRVPDLIKWALEIISLYGSEVS